MSVAPWYRRYDELAAQVAAQKAQFEARCAELGTTTDQVLQDVRRDLIARLVHESNWQEGVYLDAGRTRELVDRVFDNPPTIRGPHIDFHGLLAAHHAEVGRMKKAHASVEEIATFNLSRAHTAVGWIANELTERQSATLVAAFEQLEPYYAEFPPDKVPQAVKDQVILAHKLIGELKTDDDPAYGPLTHNIATSGELMKALSDVPFEELLHPMRVTYIHFLHAITMTGILAPQRVGHFRTSQVNVGDPNVLFPASSTLQPLMEAYCAKFPTILPSTVTYDPILTAAEASYRFVIIHPYSDGNGRVSRLLMNLVLWKHHPPVYLKADRKGRHRYAQALRRANRGNIQPLAALIAASLLEVYELLNKSLRPGLEAK